MKSHKIMQQLALTALMAATVNAFAGNNDESYTPKPFGPLGGLAHNETQSMYDRGDWLKIRFSGSLGKDFFGRALVQIQAQAARHPELLAGHVAPVFILSGARSARSLRKSHKTASRKISSTVVASTRSCHIRLIPTLCTYCRQAVVCGRPRISIQMLRPGKH